MKERGKVEHTQIESERKEREKREGVLERWTQQVILGNQVQENCSCCFRTGAGWMLDDAICARSLLCLSSDSLFLSLPPPSVLPPPGWPIESEHLLLSPLPLSHSLTFSLSLPDFLSLSDVPHWLPCFSILQTSTAAEEEDSHRTSTAVSSFAFLRGSNLFLWHTQRLVHHIVWSTCLSFLSKDIEFVVHCGSCPKLVRVVTHQTNTTMSRRKQSCPQHLATTNKIQPLQLDDPEINEGKFLLLPFSHPSPSFLSPFPFTHRSFLLTVDRKDSWVGWFLPLL